MPVDMPAPIVMPAPVIRSAAPDATEAVLIGQTADGQIGWVLVPKSQPVPAVWVVPVSAPGTPQRLTNVRAADDLVPAVRWVRRQD